MSCKQGAEVAEGVPAHELVLAEHVAGVLHLGVAGGEVVVPEQRDLFAQRVLAVEHAIEPPLACLQAVVGAGGGLRNQRRLAVEFLMPGGAGEELVDRFCRPILEGDLCLGVSGAERRPAIEMPDLLQVPGRRLGGLIRFPGSARVEFCHDRSSAILWRQVCKLANPLKCQTYHNGQVANLPPHRWQVANLPPHRSISSPSSTERRCDSPSPRRSSRFRPARGGGPG